MWTTVARRTLFVVVLLVSGAASTTIFHCTINNRAWQTPDTVRRIAAQMIGHLGWGMDSMDVVLALWLASRKDWWKSRDGYLRAALYIAAFVYGRMLFSATQDWNHQYTIKGWEWIGPKKLEPFRWPGLVRDDYARPAIDGLTLLIETWFMMPLVIASRVALTDQGRNHKATSTFSIATIVIWTVMAALIVSWVKFLTLKDIAPDTAFSSLSPDRIFRLFAVEYAPQWLIASVVALLIAWGCSRRLWIALPVAVGALLLDGLGRRCAVEVALWLGAKPERGLLGWPAVEQWSYLGGNACLIALAFATARCLGVQLRRSDAKPGDVAAKSPCGKLEDDGRR